MNYQTGQLKYDYAKGSYVKGGKKYKNRWIQAEGWKLWKESKPNARNKKINCNRDEECLWLISKLNLSQGNILQACKYVNRNFPN